MHKWVFVPATGAPISVIGAWSWAQSRQPPDYDWVRQTISALASHGARDRWIMTAGLVVLGVCHLATSAGLDQAGRAARLLLALGGAATVGTALLPQPNRGHLVAAGVALVVLAGWPVFARVPGRWGRISATAALVILLGWFTLELGNGSLLGLSERILVASEALWPLVVVARLRNRRRPR